MEVGQVVWVAGMSTSLLNAEGRYRILVRIQGVIQGYQAMMDSSCTVSDPPIQFNSTLFVQRLLQCKLYLGAFQRPRA